MNQTKELKKAGLKATLPRIKIMEVLESTGWWNFLGLVAIIWH